MEWYPVFGRIANRSDDIFDRPRPDDAQRSNLVDTRVGGVELDG